MGISALIASGLGALGVGSSTAAALAPVIGSAAIGTGLSALTGGNPGTGALVGGLSGLMGNPAISGLVNGPGQSATPAGSSGALNAAAGRGTGTANTGTAPAAAALSPGGALTRTAGGIAGGATNTSKLLSALMLAGQFAGRNQPQTPSTGSQTFNSNWNPTGYLNRVQTPNYQPASGSWQTYGQVPEPQFFSGNNLTGFAEGGALHRAVNDNRNVFVAHGGEHLVDGPGDGTSDSQPAMLSDGEYVLTAQDVARIGQGSTEAGAKKLDHMRKQLARDAGAKQFQPKVKEPIQYLKKTRRAGAR